MNSTAAHLLAAIPDPVRILGVKLRPFSMGHEMILERFGSPAIAGDIVEPGDLQFAVLVCSRTFEENLRALDSPGFWRQFFKWSTRIIVADLFRPIDWAAKIGLFESYLERGREWPPFYLEEKAAKAGNHGSPPLQTVKATLMRELGMSEAEIIDRPLSLSYWDFVTLGELTGGARIFDRDELEAMKAGADDFDRRWRERNGGGNG